MDTLKKNIAESLGEALYLDGDTSIENARDYHKGLSMDQYASAIVYAYNLENKYKEYVREEKLLTLQEQAIEEEMDDYNDLYRDL